jgi:transposase InsO family protein
MASHQGRTRTLLTLKRKFWWKGMSKQVSQYVSGCLTCKQAKTTLQEKSGLIGEYPFVDEPFEFLHIDHVGPFLPKGKEGHTYLLTIIDRASSYVSLIPVKDCKAVTTGKKLWDQVFCKFGVPRKIVSDRGTAFKNELCEELAAKAGFRWQYTTAYNPRANGKIERIHRPLKAALRGFCHKNLESWDEAAASFAFAVTPSEALKGKSGSTGTADGSPSRCYP